LTAVFVDTSAVLAMGTRTDPNHDRALTIWRGIEGRIWPLYSTSYVVGETIALLQSRFGLGAVWKFRREVAPQLDIVWADPGLHDASLDRLRAIGRRKVSLVDASSFVVMERLGLDTAFALDRHFRELGFKTL
jgi:predicted nucleic acid-binding protein